MKTFKQYIQEALDKPFKYKKVKTYQLDDDGPSTHHYSFEDNNGKHTHVYLTHVPKSSRAHVNFTDENHEFAATGKGSIRHFSTVKKIMQDHAASNPHLKSYEFTGIKSKDKKDGGGRDRLYKILTRGADGNSRDEEHYSSHWIPINRDKNGD